MKRASDVPQAASPGVARMPWSLVAAWRAARHATRLCATAVLVAAVLPGCIRTGLLPSYGDEDSRSSDVPPGTALAWNFDADAPGGAASGFAPFYGAWIILGDDTAPSGPNVYAQTSKAYEFPGAIVSTKAFADFDASVKCKMHTGLVDATAGLIFRLQNPKAYYVVQASVLEGNFRLYRYVDGVRQPVAGAETKLHKDQWYTIKVECRGENIRCTLDDALVIECTDKKYLKGKIGLWSKADSITYFDNLEVIAR